MSIGTPIDGVTSIGDYGSIPNKVFAYVKAGNALVKGEVVAWSASADDGLTVVDGALDLPIAGVVQATTASGEFLFIQTKGFCDYMTTDGSVDAGDGICAAASAVAKGVAIASEMADGAEVVSMFGYALAADSSTVLSAAIIDCFGS